jgi:ATP-dependent Clp endopeptidase proteolytic subunit ClpP
MEGHIFIYGQITSYQDEDAPKYGAVNLKDINKQLTDNKEADTIIAHINSPGGDVFEGWAIHDVLRATGKKIITQGEGIVASIATVIFLAGSERRMTDNTQLMIHNPFGFAMGDADDMQKYAERLKKEEDRIIDFYASATGNSRDDIVEMMKAETFLTADEAIEKRFATSKVEQIKAVALLKIDMNSDELTKKIEEGNKSILSKIVALFKKQGVIKDLVLKTADDQNLDFGEDIQEASQIAVGSTATVDGKPAEGEYTMPDGTIYVFAGGKVTEIKPPAEPEPAPAEDEAAKALKTENETLKSQLTEAQDALKAVKEELEAFKAEITSDIKGLKPEPPRTEGAPEVRKPFKSSK